MYVNLLRPGQEMCWSCSEVSWSTYKKKKKVRIHTVLTQTVAALASKCARNRTVGKMKESDHK